MASVCFQVHGDHLTEISRARVIEDRWDHGFKILHEGLMGISMDQVFSILKGDAKLVGVNNVDLLPDDDKDYKALLGYRFAGVWVTSGGRMLRPYAIVTSWGPDDMRQAGQITRDSDSVWSKKMGGEMSGRDLFYADDPKRDAVKQMRLPMDRFPGVAGSKEGNVAVLWAEVHNHPSIIWPPISDAQKALDQYLEHHGLPERGYANTFPADRFKVRYEVKSKDEPVPDARSWETLGEYSQTDHMKIGQHRSKAITAKNLGRSLEEYEEIQARLRPGMVGDPLQAVKRMREIASTFDQMLPEWRKEILAQNGEDFIPFEWKGKDHAIPRKPFLNWVLWRTDGAHLAPKWQMVSPQGVKMMGDDSYHTDWMIGAGFDPDAMIRDNALNDAIFELNFKLQNEMLGFEAAVLSGSGTAYGTVVHHDVAHQMQDDAILILPSAAPKYLDLALKAKAVIVEKGGAMAHLVNVAREKDLIIVRVADALTRYPNGSSVTIDAKTGKVELMQGNMKSIWEQTRT